MHGNRRDVDMGNVVAAHFGAHLSAPEFTQLTQRLYDRKVAFVSKAYIRLADTILEQESFLLQIHMAMSWKLKP